MIETGYQTIFLKFKLEPMNCQFLILNIFPYFCQNCCPLDSQVSKILGTSLGPSWRGLRDRISIIFRCDGEMSVFQRDCRIWICDISVCVKFIMAKILGKLCRCGRVSNSLFWTSSQLISCTSSLFLVIRCLFLSIIVSLAKSLHQRGFPFHYSFLSQPGELSFKLFVFTSMLPLIVTIFVAIRYL